MCSAEPAKHTMEGHRKPLPGLYVALTRASSTLTVLSAGSAIRPGAAGTLRRDGRGTSVSEWGLNIRQLPNRCPPRGGEAHLGGGIIYSCRRRGKGGGASSTPRRTPATDLPAG